MTGFTVKLYFYVIRAVLKISIILSVCFRCCFNFFYLQLCSVGDLAMSYYPPSNGYPQQAPAFGGAVYNPYQVEIFLFSFWLPVLRDLMPTVVHNVRLQFTSGLQQLVMWPVMSNRKSDYFRTGNYIKNYQNCSNNYIRTTSSFLCNSFC